MNNLDPWYQALLSLLVSEDQSYSKSDRTGTGTKSLFGVQFKHNMSEGFPLLTTKKMAWKTMVTELLWFLRGDTNIKFLHDNNCHIWDGDYEKSGRTDGELGPIYGKQWRNWEPSETYSYGCIDQIANLINELKTNPDSRRLMVSAWNVGELDQMVLPPCHYGFQVYTRELSRDERIQIYVNQYMGGVGKPAGFEDAKLTTRNIPTRAISLMWNQRSVDTFLGLPFNIASYGLLLKIIANEVNMVPDQLVGNLGDVHLYSNHIEQAKEQISRTPYELPKVNFNTEWWDEPFIEAIKSDNFCKCLLEEDIQLYDYQSHPSIKAPLSN
jgi:thymidylate synthase